MKYAETESILNYVMLDLSTGESKKYPITQSTHEKYIGGKTLAAKILYEQTAPGLPPESEDNLIIINSGFLNGTGAPSSNRFNMTFKNILTGGIASSNCGGRFGIMLRKAGLDGIIIKGKSKNLCLIEIIGGEIKIHDAEYLRGLDTEQTQDKLDSKHGALVIGPAGESLVLYACAVSGERVAGRCGSGYVMGVKNIKAITAFGTRKSDISRPEKFKEYTKKWSKYLLKHPVTGYAFPTYGSAGLISKTNASGILPTYNFSQGTWEYWDSISGETLARDHLLRNGGCIGCVIRCERRVSVDGKDVKGPEYETLGLFGSNIGNSDLNLINKMNYQCDLLGMDTISLGGTIAFAMELQKKGIADFALEFNKSDNLMEIIQKIAYREGIYSDLADGTKRMSEKFGGKDFAIHSKGLEFAAYDPRRAEGLGLGYATSSRGGCHLNGGYLVMMETSVGALNIDPFKTKGKPELTVFFQNTLEAASAAGCCLFSIQATIPLFIYKFKPSSRIVGIIGGSLLALRFLLAKVWNALPWLLPINTVYILPASKAINLASGIKMTLGKLLQAGDRGYTMERMFNIREGVGKSEDTLPERMTSEPLDGDKRAVVKIDDMLPKYYKVRGWDAEGVPTQKKLRKLGIEI